MRFEIINKDINGRSILHRCAFDHQWSQLIEILKYIGGMEVNNQKDEIEIRDLYGNTALILACIRWNEDDINGQSNQLSVVKQLLNLETDKSENLKDKDEL